MIRISKLLSDRGLCSRRQADVFIAKGWVRIDGKQIATLGQRVSPDSEIELAAEAKQELRQKVTILINKPVGYVSSQPEEGYRSAYDLLLERNHFRSHPSEPPIKLSHRLGLGPAGRLDIDSQGLLVLTQDGALAKKLIGADSTIEKEYLVRFQGQITKDKLSLLQEGLSLDGKRLKQAFVEQINPDQLKFILTEGRKRQIRRMCELVGIEVTGLKRVRIGRVRLSTLPEGKWRFLRLHEKF